MRRFAVSDVVSTVLALAMWILIALLTFAYLRALVTHDWIQLD
jgi:hypothetical protein